MGLIKVAAKIGGKLSAKVGGVISKFKGSGLGSKKAATGVMSSVKSGVKSTGLRIGAVKVAKFGAKTLLKGAAASAVGTAAVAAGGIYAAEQIAEKLGVRGGAGFIGRRKRRKARRYAHIRVPRNVRGSGRLTKSEESRLRSLAKSMANSEGSSRRRRKKGSRSKYRSAAWMAKIRKMRRR